MAVEHSIRKIIGAGYGHKPVIYKKDHVWVNIGFNYEDDYKRLTEILNLEGYSYLKLAPYLSKKDADCFLRNATDEQDKDFIKNVSKYRVSIRQNDMNKFIKNTLQINVDSVEQLWQQGAGKAK